MGVASSVKICAEASHEILSFEGSLQTGCVDDAAADVSAVMCAVFVDMVMEKRAGATKQPSRDAMTRSNDVMRSPINTRSPVGSRVAVWQCGGGQVAWHVADGGPALLLRTPLPCTLAAPRPSTYPKAPKIYITYNPAQ
jgi:hypothetical protein